MVLIYLLLFQTPNVDTIKYDGHISILSARDAHISFEELKYVEHIILYIVF